jgi:hypothetical protein
VAVEIAGVVALVVIALALAILAVAGLLLLREVRALKLKKLRPVFVAWLKDTGEFASYKAAADKLGNEFMSSFNTAAGMSGAEAQGRQFASAPRKLASFEDATSPDATAQHRDGVSDAAAA